MENNGSTTPRRPDMPRRRRRKRSPLRVFIQSYLPLLAVVAVIVAFIIFATGSIRRSNERRELARQESIAESQSLAQQMLQWEQEASDLVLKAQSMAAGYDYAGAIAVLDSFSGNLYNYDTMVTLRDSYEAAQSAMVAWSDPNQIPNLSFHLLMADPARAFANEDYGSSFKRNFISVTEFSAILQQLYDGGYILVDTDDVFTTNADGSVSAATLYLPEGKKPLMLTQTQVNYFTYMTDGDGDGMADKLGSGFASRLIVDENGRLTCEMVTATGQTVTGNYDLVPILEEFITRHPDFSFRGARATLAVCGYDGLFGYRTDPETATKISQAYYDQQLIQLPKVAQALWDAGYKIACYTYGNINYGSGSAERIRSDLDKWAAEVTPLLGQVDILAYAKERDIADDRNAYSGEKYQLLRDAGFRYFLGFCDSNTPWVNVSGDTVRIGRILVTGSNLTGKASLFEGLFDSAAVIDPSR